MQANEKPADVDRRSPQSVSARPVEGDSLEKIASEVRVCTLCPLSRTRTHAVPGEGKPDARLMLIGEGPGYNEDKQGRPFVGAAGSFLNQLLESAGLERGDVFITNVVKCRPPQNRDPLPDEIQACSGYMQRQLNLIRPAVVATLGRHSMSKYFPKERISKVHGQPRRVGNMTVVPLFHPAAALHQPSLKAAELEDFARMPEILAEATRLERDDADRTQEHQGADASEKQKLDQLRLFE